MIKNLGNIKWSLSSLYISALLKTSQIETSITIILADAERIQDNLVGANVMVRISVMYRLHHLGWKDGTIF